jgi:hypothetical protein
LATRAMHSRVSAAAAAALASEEILRTGPKSLARRHALTAEHSTGNSALALLRKAPVGHRYFNVAGRPLQVTIVPALCCQRDRNRQSLWEVTIVPAPKVISTRRHGSGLLPTMLRETCAALRERQRRFLRAACGSARRIGRRDQTPRQRAHQFPQQDRGDFRTWPPATEVAQQRPGRPDHNGASGQNVKAYTRPSAPT